VGHLVVVVAAVVHVVFLCAAVVSVLLMGGVAKFSASSPLLRGRIERLRATAAQLSTVGGDHLHLLSSFAFRCPLRLRWLLFVLWLLLLLLLLVVVGLGGFPCKCELALLSGWRG